MKYRAAVLNTQFILHGNSMEVTVILVQTPKRFIPIEPFADPILASSILE